MDKHAYVGNIPVNFDSDNHSELPVDTNALVKKARLFALKAHGSIGQRRKYTGHPYIEHPRAVALIVSQVGGNPEQIAAAWLHDTVEDTPVEIEDIKREFGSVVAKMVQELTNISRLEDGNRARRKEIDRVHLSKASSESKTIKLADMINNIESIVDNDAEFAETYIPENRLLLEVLKEGSPVLWERAKKIIDDWFNLNPPKGTIHKHQSFK